MNPIIFITILLTLILGTVITMISSNWLMAWMGLEINMFAIIPLIIKQHNPRSIEAATKYFLTQATASMILLLAALMNFMYSGQWTIMNFTNSMPPFLALMALTMKLGMAPFHFWVPEVTQGSHLTSAAILLTWQKLAPLSILYQIFPSINHNLLLYSGILSIILGGWGGLNQTQLRKILAYSSIAHMGWMAIIISYEPSLMLLNLIIYILMTLSSFMLLIGNSNTSTASLAIMSNKTPLTMIMLMGVLLSLGGLPPLSGFMPKWLIIQEMTKNNSIILPLIMAMLALLNLYFYMRLIYSSALTMFPSNNNMKMKWKYTNLSYSTLLPTMFTLSMLSLPLTPMMNLLL
ncbi:NADH dehydrogenase subunit 2 (mitochondrion) [Chrysochloris asiatica]|uniref:NADH-ubiquinone oxidoreductase chain 2 n=1 Tax=Chrysochloris asiatica TaxID=185453 RepID=Q7Y8J3_CHRAS|nr:NADH dehydrogenase subunit 2 [Chrysochloris asiatica]BAC78413.1 NADH dehydrogenase subunit 2 [Chrysochloris asiatica]